MTSIKEKIKDLFYFKDTLTVMIGIAISQAIPIAISPILTRLFTPNDFGVFALYLSIISIISIVATGRYELAVILPEDDKDAVHIVVMALMLIFITSIVLLLAILLFHDRIITLLGVPEIGSWLYWIPVSVVLTCSFQVFYYWFIRKANYLKIAVYRTLHSTGTGLGQLSGGMLHEQFFAKGLLYGSLIGPFCASLLMGFEIERERRKNRIKINLSRIRYLLGRYKNFPKFSVPGDALNTLSNQLPILILSKAFTPAIIGYYSLTNRVLAVPLSLVAKAILDVFKQKASAEYTKNGNCKDLFLRTSKALFLCAIVPFTVFFFLSPKLFEIVFGANWRIAGDYAQILSILFFFRFVASPMSFTLYIAEKQKWDMIWQLALLVGTVFSIVIAVTMTDFKVFLIAYTVIYSILYIIYFVAAYIASKGASA